MRPVLVTLSFVSSLALTCVSVGWLRVLVEVHGSEMLAATLLGAGATGLVAGDLRRPALVWATGLAIAMVGATPVMVVPMSALVALCAAAALGAAWAASLLGAARLLDERAQVLGVGALAVAAGMALTTTGLIGVIGFDGLARSSAVFAGGVAVIVVLVAGRRRVDTPDSRLNASPLRLIGLGFALGGLGLVLLSVTRLAIGTGQHASGAAIIASALVIGLVASWYDARAGDELLSRRAQLLAALALSATLVAAPRFPTAFVWAEAIARPSPEGWFFALITRVGVAVVLFGPVVAAAATAMVGALPASTRNLGRWLACVALGGAMSVVCVRLLDLEMVTALVAIVAIGSSSWNARELLPVSLVAVIALTSAGWSARLSAQGGASSWKRAAPSDARGAVELSSGAMAIHRESSRGTTRQVVRVHGFPELVTGPSSERLLIGLRAARPVRSALVLGLAPGVLETLRAHGATRVDLVINEQMLEVAKHLGIDLAGAQIHISTPRRFLEQSTERWPLIVATVARPGSAWAPRWFTLESWQAARQRLEPDGELVQQLDLLDSNTTLVRTALRTLRAVFPTGTTWGGVGSISIIVSPAPPATASAHDPGLLAWQVHTPEGQVRFAGEGPVASDRRPLLELGVTLTSFADEVAELGDERRARDETRLPLARLANDGPLSAEDFESIHRALSSQFAAWEPLVRSSAEGWLARAPDSVEAAKAVARSALAQNDCGAAAAALEPKWRVPEPSPDVVALALEALVCSRAQTAAVFHRLDGSNVVEAARAVLQRHPGHQALADALHAAEAR